MNEDNFLRLVQSLITMVDENDPSSVANYEVIDAITGGLYTSQTDLADVFSEWDEE